MQFGIDARIVGKMMDGAGRVAQCLVDQLQNFPEHRFIVFHTEHLRSTPASANVEYRLLSTPTARISNLLLTALRYNGANLDALWYPFFDLPIATSCPVALVCHDLYFMTDRNFFAAHKRWGHPLIVAVAKNRMRRATTVIAVSRTVARQARELAGISDDRIAVVYNPFHSSAAASHLRSTAAQPVNDGGYILYVGNNRNHKNLRTLVSAFAQVRSACPDIRLVLAGRIENQYADPRALFSEFGLSGAEAMHLGPVSDETLDALYRQALFVALPSLYEGFGIPAVEASARGVPVACSEIDAFQEVLGSDGALFLPPEDVDAWAEGMVALVQNHAWRRDLVRRASEHASRFTNAAFAENTIRTLERTAASAGHT